MALIQAEVDLANMSLGRIGAKQITLASCTAGTRPEDVQVNLHFEQIRDTLLRSCEWNFAVKRLALVGTWATATAYVAGQYVWINLSSSTITPTISEFSDYSGTVAGTVKVKTTASHNLKTGMYVVISGTTSYNGTYYVTYIDADEFYITATWVADDATGDLAYDSRNILFKCATANTSGTFTADLAAAKWTIDISRPSFGYKYQYDLPSDCLRFYIPDVEDFAVEGKLFLTDDTEVNIQYIYKCTDTTIWDDLFVEVFILKLALALLPALAGTSTRSIKEDLREEYRVAMSKARTVTKQETNSTGSSTWNNARFS